MQVLYMTSVIPMFFFTDLVHMGFGEDLHLMKCESYLLYG